MYTCSHDVENVVEHVLEHVLEHVVHHVVDLICICGSVKASSAFNLIVLRLLHVYNIILNTKNTES